MAEKFNVVEMREDREHEFVNMALTAACAKTVSARDLLAVCPLDMLTARVPRAIYRAMAAVADSGAPMTLQAVWSAIRAGQAANDPKAEPWPDEITAATVADYTLSIFGRREDAVMLAAQQVRAEGLKRRAEATLMGLVGDCQRYGNDPAEIASGLTALAAELDGGADMLPMGLSELMGRVVAAAENGEAGKPLPTPWPSLNRVLRGGIVPGELAILAARPGMGKTALAGCMALEVARNGVDTLFISREVKDLTIGNRLTAREGRIDLSCFRQRVDRAPNVLPAIKAASARIAGLPMRVVEKSIAPMTPREVRRLAKSIKGVGLVVVDYLQLLNPDTKQNSREREVAEMSRAMKQLALDCDCPVLLLSQLNRQVEESDRAPRLSDLRESGAIEQDADIVMFLHAKKANQGLARMPVRAIVAKGRSSGTGAANLLFDKPFSDFVEDTHADDWAAKTSGQYAAAGNDL